MTEQQYTCPSCHKDYTRFTISEHYGCGVEPLETIEDIKRELDAISEEVAEQEAVGGYGSPAETEPTAETAQQPEHSPMGDQKPAPKKRGPKPKAKVVK